MTTKWVYTLDELDEAEAAVGGDWDRVRGLLGGKGANLGEMNRLGVPVPAGFTITTEACNSYLAGDGELPTGLWEQTLTALRTMEEKSGKRFGDPSNPLLVSCRSGAKFSMPGMMDTVLDIGLNDEVTEGMIKLTGNEHFAFDSYRRLIQMFGTVVLGVRDEPFEDVLANHRDRRGVDSDGDLTGDDFRSIVGEFKDIVRRHARIEFPSNAEDQLRMATQSVFDSWNGKRARDYRQAAHIAHDLGTGVNVITMVYGNLGEGSATGVAMSRNATTGENALEGDYLTNAQGEDVVAGTRPTKPIEELRTEMPEIYSQFEGIAQRLERHYRDMQDMEFTVERGQLWILQTRTGKRTAQAAVRIAVEMADEGLINREEAVLRVEPAQIDFFLHPQFSMEAKAGHKVIARGLNVSPGAATGVVAFDPDLAERWATKDKRDVLLVRPETKPDDVHGMLAAKGTLTSSGGRTSHAALVARQFGKPAVVGASALSIDLGARVMSVGDLEINEGEWLSLDGTTGEVFAGKLETVVPDMDDEWLARLMGWADEFRRLGVRANADYPEDAERARKYGAEGIGLCRTEHMFFQPERLPTVQRMITTKILAERREAVDALLPFQRADFAGLFRAMDGLPVIIRLIDPPLHEFLPSFEELTRELTDLQIRVTNARSLDEVEEITAKLTETQEMLDKVGSLREANPMLGLRGVRLGILIPELTRMQVRAVFEAACEVTREGGKVLPEIMIPLTSHVNELRQQRGVLEGEARKVMEEQGVEVSYKFGTMIEVPRAALTADQIAEYAEFLSFGTNDLTQMTFAMSRDDAESGFLMRYLADGILPSNPFATLDEDGVGRLMRLAVTEARKTRPDIETGVCGEHGGDPTSIAVCDRLGLDYVSCSPYRVPVARLSAAQSALRSRS
ncbi:MAG: pyruvate, phosphate dikinase [Myxococcales bacterium]|jgi:pyruvate,orthophosphate dikinase|nr:pyruvate, phosphate dikinase [Myxococcales bacterium]